jgi:hypothetical protein
VTLVITSVTDRRRSSIDTGVRYVGAAGYNVTTPQPNVRHTKRQATKSCAQLTVSIVFLLSVRAPVFLKCAPSVEPDSSSAPSEVRRSF